MNLKINDQWLNKNCVWQSAQWRANTDLSPIFSGVAIYQQITKYVCKDNEIKSDSLKLINQKVLERMNDNQTLKNFV